MTLSNPRDYKQFTAGEYYHIYNRGNGKQDIFLDDEDRNFFLLRMRENLFPELVRALFVENQRKPGKVVEPRREMLPQGAFDLVAYCLMPNHYHILIRQNSDISVTKLISKVCTGYSKYFNKKYKHEGHLFQDRFRAVSVGSNEYLLWLSAYIHQNPKAAKLVKNLKDYMWSSYPDFCAGREGKLCKKDVIIEQFTDPKEYKKFIDDAVAIIEEKKDLKSYFLDADYHYDIHKS